MGVMACDRMGCENVMCDYHNDEHGYICNSCKDELIQLLDADHNKSIHNFMDTFKDPDMQMGLGEELFDHTFKMVWTQDIIPIE